MAAAAAPGFVCFAGVDFWYHSHAHSDVQLMLRLAGRHRVLLVNSIGMRTPSLRRGSRLAGKLARKLRSTAKVLRRPLPDTAPGLWVLTPLAPPPSARPSVRRLRAAAIRFQVRAAARALGLAEPVVVVTVPTAWDVVAPMPRSLLLYNRSDRHSEFPGIDRGMVEDVEAALLRHADRVLYASPVLLADERSLVGERGVLLEHGVDLERFRPEAGPEPPELADVPRPRVGFLGSLRGHLVDLPLLAALADAVPEAVLVLVGDAPEGLGPLAGRRNVRWIGKVPHERVPAFGVALDVALMPYRDNEWIRCSSPIKLREYLALGLPVVSTDFPAARASPEVRVAATPEVFVAAVRDALAAGNDDAARARRRAVVADASWDARAEALSALCGGRH